MYCEPVIVKLLHQRILDNTTKASDCLFSDFSTNSIGHKSKYYNIKRIVWLFHHPTHVFTKWRVIQSCKTQKCININHLYYSHNEVDSKAGILERLMIDSVIDGECIIARYQPNPRGYGEVTINKRTYQLHRIIWWIYSEIENIEDIPDKQASDGAYIIRHQCRNLLCLNKNHYRLGTQADNSNDMIKDGTRLMGEKNHKSTITLEKAQEIADSWKDKSHVDCLTQIQRASEFNVSISIIRGIDARNTWPEIIHPNGKTSIPRNPRTRLTVVDMTENDWEQIIDKVKEITTVNEFDNEYCRSRCWESPPQIEFSKLAYKTRSKAAYIWACESNNKRFIRNGQTVRHLCGNGPKCCNPSHLVFGTMTEQAADRRLHGTSSQKLTIEKARAILSDTRAQKLIAAEFSVSISTVSQIKNGKSWKE